MNWQRFMDITRRYNQKNRWLIDHAYQSAKASHRPQTRESGERYFEHVRAVPLTILLEFNLWEYFRITSGLLHDTIEDTTIFGNKTKMSYQDLTNQARFIMTKTYGRRTAEAVIAVTRPHIDNTQFYTKSETENYSLDLLRDSQDGIILKMGDRLHNLRTLWHMPEEKITAKIIETRDRYYPIFELARKDHPTVVSYAINEMEKAISKIESRSLVGNPHKG